MSTSPNIIYIYADDLGHGMLSCYGQRHFRTPNIDRLAAGGMRFNRAYGCVLCAPARASLLTGMHDVHAGGWTFNQGGLYQEHHVCDVPLEDLYEIIQNTGIRPRDGRTYLPTVARRAGYATGQIGKLEWGFTTEPDELAKHGWDHHYGYYDHVQCHGFYPPYLFRDGIKEEIPGNTRDDFGKGSYGPFPGGRVEHDPEGRAVYSQDLFDEAIRDFLRAHREEPFFLYHPTQLPHGPVYFPDIYPELRDNPNLTEVEKEYASMVVRLDRTVGMILEELDALGLRENTLVMFASDNGHYPCYEQPGRVSAKSDLQGNPIDNRDSRFTTESCGDPLDGNGGLAGLKTTNWEGGARVPFIARWPGHIPEGRVSDHLLANYDMLATFADLLGADAGSETDGISCAPVLFDDKNSPQHDCIVYASQYGPSLVTRDGWKLRTFLQLDKIVDFPTFGTSLEALDDAITCQLYHLPSDPTEANDQSKNEPAKCRELRNRLLKECDGNFVHGTPEAHFAFYAR